jgi:hypothetical protein
MTSCMEGRDIVTRVLGPKVPSRMGHMQGLARQSAGMLDRVSGASVRHQGTATLTEEQGGSKGDAPSAGDTSSIVRP